MIAQFHYYDIGNVDWIKCTTVSELYVSIYARTYSMWYFYIADLYLSLLLLGYLFIIGILTPAILS